MKPLRHLLAAALAVAALSTLALAEPAGKESATTTATNATTATTPATTMACKTDPAAPAKGDMAGMADCKSATAEPKMGGCCGGMK